MPLKVLPLAAGDTRSWAEIYYPAFSPGTIGILWKEKPSEESITGFGDALKSGLEKPETHAFKCVDTDLNDKIIAVAKWSVYEKPRSMEEVEEGFVLRKTFPEDNVDARREFMQGIWDSRREFMGGQPHVILDTLICHPDHHRRGAGRMLMQWGLDKADELGLPAYLEASAAGVRLYQSVGFEPQKELIFDATKYGGRAKDVHMVSGHMDLEHVADMLKAMIRPPKPST